MASVCDVFVWLGGGAAVLVSVRGGVEVRGGVDVCVVRLGLDSVRDVLVWLGGGVEVLVSVRGAVECVVVVGVRAVLDSFGGVTVRVGVRVASVVWVAPVAGAYLVLVVVAAPRVPVDPRAATTPLPVNAAGFMVAATGGAPWFAENLWLGFVIASRAWLLWASVAPT